MKIFFRCLQVAICVAVLGLTAMPAWADVACVQRELTRLGYDPGPVDGLMGGRTRSAADLFGQDEGLDLPPLDDSGSDAWCVAVKARTAGLPRFDVVSPPKGVLPDSQAEQLWNAYKTAKECFDHPTYGQPLTYSGKPPSAKAAAALDWQSPFTTATGNKACVIGQPDFARPPAPLPVVRLDERYGERVGEADRASDWFRAASTFARLSNDPEARARLKAAVLDWAKADSLGRGIHVSWGRRPVDYQMMTLIIDLVAATAEVSGDLTAEERAVVGPWLGKLVVESANSRWKDRQDNKKYMGDYLMLIWALMAGDDASAQQAIDAFKLAIHDVRPDGSFPVDTQRSGMGVTYNANSASYLVMAAAAIRQAAGLDLFSYEVEGRSGHTVVEYLVKSIKEPGPTNAAYAISCPDGGDRWGTVDRPSVHFIEESSFLLAYADLYPDRAVSDWIREQYASRFEEAAINEHAGGAPACQFAMTTDPDYTAEPVTIVEYELPEPGVVVHTREELAHGKGTSSRVNSLLFAEVEGRKGLSDFGFNIRGSFSSGTGDISGLSFAIQEPLGKDAPAALRNCRGFSTNVYDDGLPRLVFQMSGVGAQFTAPDISCIKDVVPGEIYGTAEFLTKHFRDIAIGMFVDGSARTLEHDGLRDWMEKVAYGQIIVGGN